MLSLNQQKQLFNDKQLNLANLSSGTFMFDPPAEQISANGGIKYPLTAIETVEADLDTNVFSTEFNFVLADLVHLDRSSKDDVMSAMLQNCLDLYSKIKWSIQYDYEQDIALTSKFQPLEDFNDDGAYGWGFSIKIQQFYDRSVCNTPDSDNHAGQVIIYNSDGSVAAYLNPNSTYTLNAVVTDTEEHNVNFSGTYFALSNTPVFITGVFVNGQRLTLTTDYTVSGATITFNNALANDIVVVVYSY